uniref:helix-hairpin-helix domain-containing protein n=1 Tax=Neisseria meningitidis TaxID=487 RepID=UPI001F015B9A
GIRGGLRGYLGRIRRYLGRKQPKTCVWVSAVGRDRNFAKVSGPAKAKAIAEYRAQNGAFKSVDDLTKVKGIGPAVLAKLKDQASVGAPAPKGPAKPVLPAVKK